MKPHGKTDVFTSNTAKNGTPQGEVIFTAGAIFAMRLFREMLRPQATGAPAAGGDMQGAAVPGMVRDGGVSAGSGAVGITDLNRK